MGERGSKRVEPRKTNTEAYHFHHYIVLAKASHNASLDSGGWEEMQIPFAGGMDTMRGRELWPFLKSVYLSQQKQVLLKHFWRLIKKKEDTGNQSRIKKWDIVSDLTGIKNKLGIYFKSTNLKI